MAKKPVQLPDAVEIKLADVRASKDNPRKSFDAEKTKALAESIKAQGVLQPILVRANTDGRSTAKYEIIAGERRFRASKLAEKDTIPARILEADDEQAADMRLAENDQREDISPIDRAAAYQERLDGGKTVEELAQIVGKSISGIREALLLGRCPEKLADAVTEGRVSGSVASLVCRVPNKALRERVSLHVLAGEGWYGDRKPPKTDGGSNTLSYRETKSLIQNNCMCELKGAPFDRDDAKLVKGAGTCEECPKRLGNMMKDDPDGFDANGRPDICMDPDCYDKKVKATTTQKLGEAKEAGRKVLPRSQALKLWSYGGKEVEPFAPYIDLDRPLSDYGKDRRTYRDVLSAELSNGLADKVVVAVDEASRSHDLIDKTDVKSLLAKQGITVYMPREGFSPKSQKDLEEDRKRLEAKREKEREIQTEITRRKYQLAGAAAEKLGFDDPAGRLLRLVASALTPCLNNDAYCAVEGLSLNGQPKMTAYENLRLLLSTGDKKVLLRAIGVGLYETAVEIGDGELLDEIGTLFGIDDAAIECEVKEELSPPQKS